MTNIYIIRNILTHTPERDVFFLRSTQPHGRAWKIHDKHLLISDVIPKYFVCKKYESFTRQLNGWGFKRLHQSGPGEFYILFHEASLPYEY
jgi:hypothetical protein